MGGMVSADDEPLRPPVDNCPLPGGSPNSDVLAHGRRVVRHQNAEGDVVAFAVFEGFPKGLLQVFGIGRMHEIEERPGDQVFQLRAEELLQRRCGGDPVQVRREPADHPVTGGAADVACRRRSVPFGIVRGRRLAATFRLLADLRTTSPSALR